MDWFRGPEEGQNDFNPLRSDSWVLGDSLALMSLYLLYILETDRIDSLKKKKKRGAGAIVRVGAIADDVLEGENKYFFKRHILCFFATAKKTQYKL